MSNKTKRPTSKNASKRPVSWMQITLVIISIIIVLSMILSQAINL